MRMCTPRPISSRIIATPSLPGTKYGEMMMSSCFAEVINAAMLFAIVTSSCGEVSLAIFAGPSASTVAGTQVSVRSLSSSSCSNQLALADVPVSISGGNLASSSTAFATMEAIG